MRLSTFAFVTAALFSSVSFAACGDSDEGSSDISHDTGMTSDTGAGDAVADAGDVESAAMTITAALEGASATVGQNALLITLTDADGMPVSDATIVVDPQMPAMGHGSSEDPVVTNNGDGTYRAFPVTFTMGGPWEVTVTATSGDHTAELVLNYNVQ